MRAAVAAFPEWSNFTAQKRADCMNRLADLLESRVEEFALAESIDQGKTYLHAKTVRISDHILIFSIASSSRVDG